MTLLRVDDLEVSHGPLQALWGVSLAISAGEKVGLLGANGAGKSTTLGAIIGHYPAQAGRITFDGRDETRSDVNSRLSRGMALVPEGRRLFVDMSVRENLEMGAYLSGPRRSLAQSLEQVFTLFPILKEKERQAAGTLSGGQQQMVAIGRALMSRPRLLLLDEPFIGVAPLIIRDVMQALAQIAADGITIVLVEQNIHRALEFVERAYVIENGKTVLEGSRDQLLGDPTFSAKLLGLD
jgi:branched-chain amino acid transport system ATP-binding protein